jgi:hypothetical protein
MAGLQQRENSFVVLAQSQCFDPGSLSSPFFSKKRGPIINGQQNNIAAQRHPIFYEPWYNNGATPP